MSGPKGSRPGAIAYTRDRWGRRFLAAIIGPGLVLAMSVVVYQVTVNGQTMAETLADNLGPVLIAGALGVLLWLPVAFVWGLKQQRDEAWSKLDVLTSRLAGPPSV